MKPFLLLFLFAFAVISAYSSPKIKYAQNFMIKEADGYKLLTVSNPWRGSGDVQFAYALVSRDSRIPDSIPDTVAIVRTPVERLITFSTIYLGFINELELHDKLVGAAHVDLSTDPRIHEQVDKGETEPVQSGSALDIESIILLRPDLILTSNTDESQFDVHPQIARAKLPVTLTASYMENHPLARAEWIKFIAAFFEKDKEAEFVFEGIANQYNTLANQTRSVTRRPTVFTNAPFAGQWRLPGGKSFTAKAIEDAGGRYLWDKDESSGGIPLDFERVFHTASDADCWIHPGSYKSLPSLLSLDQRFAKFKAFQTGRIFNNSKRVNEKGGNDIWERGIAHPEEVLADLIKILHPDLLPEHEFIYYEQLK